jgi:threonine dehydratase
MDLATIRAVRKEIAPYIQKTPLIRAWPLEQALKTQARLFLKCEQLQWTNSFKVRGAFAALLHLSPQEKKRGVITRSAGNFAQAVARAAQQLKVGATIIMPLAVPLVKKEATAQYGATIVLHGKTQKEEQDKVAEIAEKEKCIVLSPYDHLDVIAGQGSMALEIDEELPSIKNFVGQIGGGGLLSGMATAFKGLKPKIRTIGVEPIGAQDYFLSRKEGKRRVLENITTIADGLKAPQVGALNWPLLQKYVDETRVVSEDAIKKAMAFLYKEMGILVEPSGATGVAALFDSDPLEVEGDTVFVLSGGNVDRDKFYTWVMG